MGNAISNFFCVLINVLTCIITIGFNCGNTCGGNGGAVTNVAPPVTPSPVTPVPQGPEGWYLTEDDTGNESCEDICTKYQLGCNLNGIANLNSDSAMTFVTTNDELQNINTQVLTLNGNNVDCTTISETAVDSDAIVSTPLAKSEDGGTTTSCFHLPGDGTQSTCDEAAFETNSYRICCCTVGGDTAPCPTGSPS